MSSNDEIVIIEKRGRWEIHHNLCVDNMFVPSKNTMIIDGKRKDLKRAIERANEYNMCDGYPTEYGLRFILKEKK